MSDNWSDGADDGDEEELPPSPRRTAPPPRTTRVAPAAARPPAGTRTPTTVAARRAAARPPQRDTFPLAVSAVVVVLLLGMMAVFVLNRSDSVTPAAAPVATVAGAAVPVTAPANAATAAPDAQAAVPRMALADFKALYDNPAQRPLILDVRAKENYDQGHIAGSINFPEADLDARVKELPKDKLIIAYCQ